MQTQAEYEARYAAKFRSMNDSQLDVFKNHAAWRAEQSVTELGAALFRRDAEYASAEQQKRAGA